MSVRNIMSIYGLTYSNTSKCVCSEAVYSVSAVYVCIYPQKLALTSPTGGGRSVGLVRLRTKATEL